MIIVQIAGHLGRDPETRFTASGQKVTNLTVATNVRKAGKDETVWWRVTIWGERFDKMLPHFKKGSAVIVVGEMNKPEIWTDKEGRPQVNLELNAEIIRFSPFGKPDAKPESASSHNAHQQSANNAYNGFSGTPDAKPDAPSGYNSAGFDNSYTDFGGNTSAYPQAGNANSNPYGSAQGAAQPKYGQNIPRNEEQIPF